MKSGIKQLNSLEEISEFALSFVALALCVKVIVQIVTAAENSGIVSVVFHKTTDEIEGSKTIHSRDNKIYA